MDWHKLPSLSALRAFEAASRNLSFSRAARELNVTHAAVIQQVRRLEDHLGVSLLVAKGRALSLSDEGARLAECLTIKFSGISRVVQEISHKLDADPIVISTTPAFASEWLVPHLFAFRELCPDVNLTVDPAVGLVDFNKTVETDLAIRFGDGQWPGCKSEILIKTNAVIACSADFVRGIAHPDIRLVSELPWLQETGSNELADYLEAFLGQKPRTKRNIHLPGHLLLKALNEGRGIAVTSRFFIEEGVKDGRITVLHEFGSTSQTTGYHLVRGGRPLRKPAEKFASWLRRTCVQ
jgi:LysR family glycine cleavage system transcriptional activator